MNVHFICRGNVLRSLIAETYLKSLGLESVHVLSSGMSVNWEDPKEKEYYANTLSILDGHGIKQYAKPRPEQLTQQRIDIAHDVIVLMNQRVVDEALELVRLPVGILDWGITDIGEGHRTRATQRELYEEDIYQEITKKVDELVSKL